MMLAQQASPALSDDLSRSSQRVVAPTASSSTSSLRLHLEKCNLFVLQLLIGCKEKEATRLHSSMALRRFFTLWLCCRTRLCLPVNRAASLTPPVGVRVGDGADETAVCLLVDRRREFRCPSLQFNRRSSRASVASIQCVRSTHFGGIGPLMP
jgi:hypothetical protein